MSTSDNSTATTSSSQAANFDETESNVNPTSDTLHPASVTPSNTDTSIRISDNEVKQCLFKCDLCHWTYDSLLDLNSHMSRKHERKYKCDHPGCYSSFDFKIDMNRHLRTHQAEGSPRLFSCLAPDCDKAFSRKDNMLKHFEKKHS
ncbi:Nn.00g089190.m01.CDS01 [Neocucurbitaria sp. VM-36]